MNSSRLFLAALICALPFSGSASAQMQILAEDRFESNQNRISFTQDPGPGTYSDPTGDGFEIYRVDISASIPQGLVDDSFSVFPFDRQGIIDASSDSPGAWFGVIDTVNDDQLPASNPGVATATWVFDISQATSSDLEVSIDMGAMGDFEDGTEPPIGNPPQPVLEDSFNWTYSIDGGASFSLFASMIDTSGTHDYTLAGEDPVEGGPLVVSLDDPLFMTTTDNQTILLDNNLQSITSPIVAEPNSSTLTIVLTAEADGGTEAYAFDNIVVEEVLTGCQDPPCMALGDYDASGTTELRDLNLVLFNWGMPDELLPTNWINQRPIPTIVGLVELNHVWFNWGATGGALGFVPEPATSLLLLTGWMIGLVARRNRF